MESELLKEARQLQVWRKSDHPKMQTASIWGEVLALRLSKKRQVRKAARVKRFLDALVLDLWVASTCEDNPWRSVSRDKSDYQKEGRYRKIFFKYDLFIPLLDDLISLGYVDQKKGYQNMGNQKMSYQSRIMATDKLLASCTEWDIQHVVQADDVPLSDVIRLRDKDKRLIDYEDSERTIEMRARLDQYNAQLGGSKLSVEGVKADTSMKRMHRVFNNSSFEKGGRFYGGFWQGLRQRQFMQRQQLRIDDEEVTELDFKSLHPSFLYRLKELPVPEDAYSIEGVDRQSVKDAFLVIVNCDSRKQALDTMRHEKGIKDAESVLAAIECKHSQLSEFFFLGEDALGLQHMDSLLADAIMKDLYAEGIVVLPIHDSFIVAKKNEGRLREVMIDWYYDFFGVVPLIDKKY